MIIQEGQTFTFRDRSVLRILCVRDRPAGTSVFFELEHPGSLARRHWMLTEDFKIYYEEILANPNQHSAV